MRTSPERPEADSRLVNAITALVSAKTKFDQVGAVPRWIGSMSVLGLKNRIRPITTMNACRTRSPATRKPTRRARRWLKPRMLLSDDQRDERQRDRECLVAVAERIREHAQVLRGRVGRDGDQDDVVEQDRPARDEAHELVERVAGEHARAAPVLVQRGSLDVGHRRDREHQRGDQEHERGEPERVARDHPEREVQGARQRRVDDREEDRRADAAARDRPRAGRELRGRALAPGARLGRGARRRLRRRARGARVHAVRGVRRAGPVA